MIKANWKQTTTCRWPNLHTKKVEVIGFSGVRPRDKKKSINTSFCSERKIFVVGLVKGKRMETLQNRLSNVYCCVLNQKYEKCLKNVIFSQKSSCREPSEFCNRLDTKSTQTVETTGRWWFLRTLGNHSGQNVKIK